MNDTQKPTPIKDPAPVYVGMGGWDLPPFENVFYPPNPGKGFRKLSWYSRFFDFVELNASFYNSAISRAQATRWMQEVAGNPRFLFTVKLFRGFTHSLDATAGDLVAIQRLLSTLHEGNKCGGLVIQFPSRFHCTSERIHYLLKIIEAFREFTCFVELRNSSWATPALPRLSEDHRFCLVNTDIPPLPHHVSLHARAFHGNAYFRMMGRNVETWNNPERGDRYAYRYSESELRELLQKIAEVRPVAPKTFVVFHNDPNIDSPVNGFQLRKMLRPAEHLSAPSGLIARFPELAPIITNSVGNESLFESR